MFFFCWICMRRRIFCGISMLFRGVMFHYENFALWRSRCVQSCLACSNSFEREVCKQRTDKKWLAFAFFKHSNCWIIKQFEFTGVKVPVMLSKIFQFFDGLWLPGSSIWRLFFGISFCHPLHWFRKRPADGARRFTKYPLLPENWRELMFYWVVTWV